MSLTSIFGDEQVCAGAADWTLGDNHQHYPNAPVVTDLLGTVGKADAPLGDLAEAEYRFIREVFLRMSRPISSTSGESTSPVVGPRSGAASDGYDLLRAIYARWSQPQNTSHVAANGFPLSSPAIQLTGTSAAESISIQPWTSKASIRNSALAGILGATIAIAPGSLPYWSPGSGTSAVLETSPLSASPRTSEDSMRLPTSILFDSPLPLRRPPAKSKSKTISMTEALKVARNALDRSEQRWLKAIEDETKFFNALSDPSDDTGEV